MITNNAAQEVGQLSYSVSFRGKPLVDRSGLALEMQGQRALGTNVKIDAQHPSQTDETYRLVTGKASTVRNHFNALQLKLIEPQPPRRTFLMEARAYDDAVAFRYLIPDQSGLREFRLKNESTEFRISKDAVTYALVLPNFRTSYESEYIRLNASAFANRNSLSTTNLIGLPLLMEVPGVGWMAITEADLRG